MGTKEKVVIGLVVSLAVIGVIIFALVNNTGNDADTSAASSSLTTGTSSVATSVQHSSSVTASSTSASSAQNTSVISGLNAYEGLEKESAGIELALADYIGNELGPNNSDLSVTSFTLENKDTGDATMIIHDANSGLDYLMLRQNDKWSVNRTSELPLAETSSSSEDKPVPSSASTDDINKQNQWAPISNFNNSIFDIDDAILLPVAAMDHVISEKEADAIEIGVSQLLSEAGVSDDNSTSIFIEKKSISQDSDGRPVCKILVNHLGGSTVITSTYDEKLDGVYLSLYEED